MCAYCDVGKMDDCKFTSSYFSYWEMVLLVGITRYKPLLLCSHHYHHLVWEETEKGFVKLVYCNKKKNGCRYFDQGIFYWQRWIFLTLIGCD
jgi:hypothetical protein